MNKRKLEDAERQLAALKRKDLRSMQRKLEDAEHQLQALENEIREKQSGTADEFLGFVNFFNLDILCYL